MRALRVLHCPFNIGGNPGILVQAERQLGLDSRLVTFRPSPLGYPSDETLTQDDNSSVALLAARMRLLWRALTWADVVHFNFGQTCLTAMGPPSLSAAFAESLRRGVWQVLGRCLFMKDLPALRAAGKRIAVTFQGDDARQSQLADRLYEWGLERGRYTDEGDRIKKRVINSFARYADVIFSLNPDLLRVLPARTEFLPYTIIDPARVTPVAPRANKVPIIVHAPTNRSIKGTQYLLDALASLRAEGVAFELDLVEGVPNHVALERYRGADIVVDQILLGWYGGFAVEVMAMGKPVVAHIHDEDAKGVVPDAMLADLPVIRASPVDVREVLRSWLGPRRDQLAELGIRSRAYVTRWHDPVKIAKRTAASYLQMTRGDIRASHEDRSVAQ